MKNHSLNIVLSKTVTKIGSMIRTVVGGDYNHCSFFIDDEVDAVYGFSRKYRKLWYTGCFTLENPIYYEDYKVYEIPISDSQYGDLQNRIDDMNSNVRMYNYVSAMLIPAKIPVESDGSFICSTFVADLIDKYTDIELDKDLRLYTPMDTFELLDGCADRGYVKATDVKLPEKEEIPLDFSTVLKDWESSVKDVTERNKDSIHSKMEAYEKWLRDVIHEAEEKIKR